MAVQSTHKTPGVYEYKLGNAPAFQNQTTLFSSMNSSASYGEDQAALPQFRPLNLNVILNTQSLNPESPAKSPGKQQRPTRGMKENAGNEFAGLQ